MTPSVDTTEAEYTNTRKKIKTFDDILPYIGGAGRYQWFLFFLLLPFASSYAFLYFTQFFLTLTPEEHWCTVPELNGWNFTDDQRCMIVIVNGLGLRTLILNTGVTVLEHETSWRFSELDLARAKSSRLMVHFVHAAFDNFQPINPGVSLTIALT